MNIENAVKNLAGRGFGVSRFASKEEARDYLAGKLSGAVVGMGDSARWYRWDCSTRCPQ
jgi:hypothetical protein